MSARTFLVECLVEFESEAPWRLDEHNESKLAVVFFLVTDYRGFHSVRFVLFDDFGNVCKRAESLFFLGRRCVSDRRKRTRRQNIGEDIRTAIGGEIVSVFYQGVEFPDDDRFRPRSFVARGAFCPCVCVSDRFCLVVERSDGEVEHFYRFVVSVLNDRSKSPVSSAYRNRVKTFRRIEFVLRKG